MGPVLQSYAPALVFIALGALIGGLFVFVNSALGPKRKQRPTTREPYESGMPSEVKSGFRFGISFYMIAMLFLLFDIEVVFLFPLSVQLRDFGWFGVGAIGVFLLPLIVTFVYEWRRGALSWR
jgi:NADH-quinone oxidoreductase subunit A